MKTVADLAGAGAARSPAVQWIQGRGASEEAKQLEIQAPLLNGGCPSGETNKCIDCYLKVACVYASHFFNKKT